jgi:hypothetical protein
LWPWGFSRLGLEEDLRKKTSRDSEPELNALWR